MVNFYKYQATGNDFVVVDNFDQNQLWLDYVDIVPALCHRRFGVGADGVILLQKKELFSFEMIFFNPDASQSFCGNGSRCAMHLAHHLGLSNNMANFLAIDGFHTAAIQHNGVRISINPTHLEPYQQGYVLNTGSPHYVCLVDSLEMTNVESLGNKINEYKLFRPTGTNVNFVKLEPHNCLSMRTYERGVYAETFSCGTGAVAAALVAAQKGYHSPVKVRTKGGPLVVEFIKEGCFFSSIYLSGPVAMVFEGKCSLTDIL